ncbi:hypothetical protein D3C83_117960 [compost metagenome]
MQRLIEVARARGLETMVGWVLAGNAGMLEMVSQLGFAQAVEPGDALVRRVSLRL